MKLQQHHIVRAACLFGLLAAAAMAFGCASATPDSMGGRAYADSRYLEPSFQRDAAYHPSLPEPPHFWAQTGMSSVTAGPSRNIR